MCAGTQTERAAQAKGGGPLSSLRLGSEATHKAAENTSCEYVSSEERRKTTQLEEYSIYNHLFPFWACVRSLQILVNLIREDVQTQMHPVLQYELEEKKKSESLQNVPEFVRVRGTLKRIQTFS